jgi:tetratricopeptide (TPR) repeat protein
MTPEELGDAINQLPWTNPGEQALKLYNRAVEFKTDNPGSWYKLGITLFDGGYYPEGFESFKKHIDLGSSGLQLFTAYVWMGHLKDLMNQRNEALRYYREALKNDVGSTMRHDQYGMQINRAYVEKRLKEPFTRGEK